MQFFYSLFRTGMGKAGLLPLPVILQKCFYQNPVFPVFDRTRAVYQNAAGFYITACVVQNFLLQRRKIPQPGFRFCPARFRPASQHAQAGAGRIHQHPVKGGFPLFPEHAAVLQFCLYIFQLQPGRIFCNQFQFMGVDVTGRHPAGIFHQGADMGGFTARRGAQVQHPFPRLRR